MKVTLLVLTVRHMEQVKLCKAILHIVGMVITSVQHRCA